MHILYLSSTGGGLDTNVRVLAPALVQAGHRVSVLYIHFPNEAIPDSPTEIDGYRVYHTRMGSWHYYARRATFGLTSLPLAVRAIEYGQALGRVVAEMHQRDGLDLVELPEVSTLAGIRDVPYLVRLHSAAWTWRRMLHEPSGLSDSLEIRMEGSMLQQAHAISSPSVALAKYVHKTCGLGARLIETIPYPLDTAQFAPAEEKDIPPLILFVGRIEKRKGADVLMRAIPLITARHPNCPFVFAGRVSGELREQVAAMPNGVRFLGVQPREQLVQWYQRASVFVAPSLWDNSPNTVYEAMACGTPVVASRVGGIPELVDDGVTGLLVPPSDPAALADAVIALLGDPTRRARMGQHGREKAVACYSLDKILERTRAFYQQALER